MAIRSLQTSRASETEALGAELARGLCPGDVVLVKGELGAGKTTLVRGAARELGVEAPVTSPTFTIGNRYRVPPKGAPSAEDRQAGGLTVSHLDLYRVEELAREDPALLADYLGEEEIAFVEWPQDGALELAGARLIVRISHRGADSREVEVEDRGPRTAGAGAAGGGRA